MIVQLGCHLQKRGGEYFLENGTRELKSIFVLEVVKSCSQYLGLPSTINRNKRNMFDGIKERVMKRLIG